MGEEIWRQIDGKVDAFVHSVGTAASSRGVATVLKRYRPGIRVVIVEPAEFAVLGGGEPGPHKIEGIGIGYRHRRVPAGLAAPGPQRAQDRRVNLPVVHHERVSHGQHRRMVIRRDLRLIGRHQPVIVVPAEGAPPPSRSGVARDDRVRHRRHRKPDEELGASEELTALATDQPVGPESPKTARQARGLVGRGEHDEVKRSRREAGEGGAKRKAAERVPDDSVGFAGGRYPLEPVANATPDAVERLDRGDIAKAVGLMPFPPKEAGKARHGERRASHPVHQQQPHLSQ